MSNSRREVWAALLRYRDEAGRFDQKAVHANLMLISESKVDGVVLNGGTGEYIAAEAGELPLAMKLCREASLPVIVGIGAASMDASIDLGRSAFDDGATAVLLPAPHFFRYSQDDIAAWCGTIASAVPGPVLLYNLPQFTNALEVNTVEDLLAAHPERIAGIKDSSGSLEILRALRGAKRIVGNDQVLVQACREGICDAVISGVAGVLPELIHLLATVQPEEDRFHYQAGALLLDEYLDQIQRFPAPWGLKWTAQFRGIALARFLQPLSPYRIEQAQLFSEWSRVWWERVQSVLETGKAAPCAEVD